MVEHRELQPAGDSGAAVAAAVVSGLSFPSCDSTHHDSPVGSALEPVLLEACAGRLSGLSWFRTSWQRGGAATAYALWHDDAGLPRPAVVKLPVPPVELFWLRHLQAAGDVAPRLFVSDQSLGPYDLAWVLMERLEHGPLSLHWNGLEFDLAVQALGRFYVASRSVPLPAPGPEKDWKRVCEQARRHIAEDHDIAHEQRWKNALKAAQKKLGFWLSIWNARSRTDWCHGDFQLANAMTRQPAPAGPALLIDYALVHPGHWIEDAVYLEHLFWARRARLGGRKLVSMIAHERHRLGLPVEPDWPLLAAVKRGLLAMSTPAMLQADGDPHHVQAALEVLEIEVK